MDSHDQVWAPVDAVLLRNGVPPAAVRVRVRAAGHDGPFELCWDDGDGSGRDRRCPVPCAGERTYVPYVRVHTGHHARRAAKEAGVDHLWLCQDPCRVVSTARDVLDHELPFPLSRAIYHDATLVAGFDSVSRRPVPLRPEDLDRLMAEWTEGDGTEGDASHPEKDAALTPWDAPRVRHYVRGPRDTAVRRSERTAGNRESDVSSRELASHAKTDGAPPSTSRDETDGGCHPAGPASPLASMRNLESGCAMTSRFDDGVATSRANAPTAQARTTRTVRKTVTRSGTGGSGPRDENGEGDARERKRIPDCDDDVTIYEDGQPQQAANGYEEDVSDGGECENGGDAGHKNRNGNEDDINAEDEKEEEYDDDDEEGEENDDDGGDNDDNDDDDLEDEAGDSMLVEDEYGVDEDCEEKGEDDIDDVEDESGAFDDAVSGFDDGYDET